MLTMPHQELLITKLEFHIKAFNNWRKDRAIPPSRSKFKEVLSKLDITPSIELLERCFGLSLSDQYWIKEELSHAKWNEINFFESSFSEDMGKLPHGTNR